MQLPQYYGIVPGVNHGMTNTIPLNNVYAVDGTSLSERQQDQSASNRNNPHSSNT